METMNEKCEDCDVPLVYQEQDMHSHDTGVGVQHSVYAEELIYCPECEKTYRPEEFEVTD